MVNCACPHTRCTLLRRPPLQSVKSDEELYGWLDDIYNGSPLNAHAPTNFVHQIHVGFDPNSGAFTGLPEQWTKLLTSSAITKEDYQKNPQAVLDVLEFYTENQKRGNNDWAPAGPAYSGAGASSTTTTSMSQVHNTLASQPARFNNGTGYAGAQAAAQGHSSSSGYGSMNGASSMSSKPLPSTNNGTGSLSQPGPNGLKQLNLPNSNNYNGGGRTIDVRKDSDRPLMQANRAPPAAPGPIRVAPAPPSNVNARPTQPQQQPQQHIEPAVKPLQAMKNVPAPTGDPVSSVSKPAVNAGSSAPARAPPATAAPPAAAPPAAGPVQAVAATEEKRAGDRRISTMTDAQITAKLRSIVSPRDPSKLYSKIKKVGQGASGSVYVAKDLDLGHKVAIKQMDLAAQPRKELIVNEILVMKDSKHPNIVNFLESYLVKANELWVVMEYMEGGALTDVIDNNQLEEDQIACISLEVSEARLSEAKRSRIAINERRLTLFPYRLAKGYSICIISTSSIVTSSRTMYSWTHKVTSKLVRAHSHSDETWLTGQRHWQRTLASAPSLQISARSGQRWLERHTGWRLKSFVQKNTAQKSTFGHWVRSLALCIVRTR